MVIALENSPEFKVVGFLDDNINLHRQYLLGKKIYSLDNLEKLIQLKEINLVFLALPSINRQKRNQIIDDLNRFKIRVKTLPSIQDIVDGKISISDIRIYLLKISLVESKLDQTSNYYLKILTQKLF